MLRAAQTLTNGRPTPGRPARSRLARVLARGPDQLLVRVTLVFAVAPVLEVTVTVLSTDQPELSVSSVTSTGMLPSPLPPPTSWSAEGDPLHLAPPLVLPVHDCREPAEIAATPEVRPDTYTGNNPQGVLVIYVVISSTCGDQFSENGALGEEKITNRSQLLNES